MGVLAAASHRLVLESLEARRLLTATYQVTNFGEPGISGKSSVTTGDFDGDGDQDLILGRSIVVENVDGEFAVGNATSIRGLKNGGGDLVVADFDNDGKDEIVGADGTLWTSGRVEGELFFQPNAIPEWTWPGRAVDFDGDSDLDIVTTTHWLEFVGGDQWFLPKQSVSPFNSRAVVADAADMNNDGEIDYVNLAQVGSEFIVEVHLRNGDGFRQAMEFAAADVSSSTFDLVDLDSDGWTDIVSYRAWWKNVNGERFEHRPIDLRGVTSRDPGALADFDSDGDLDILYSTDEDEVIGWLANDGRGNFGERNDLEFIGKQNGQPVDIDGDGDIDILAQTDYYHNRTVFYENLDGRGTFAASRPIGTSYGSIHIKDSKPIDVDGDGDQDLVGVFPTFAPESNNDVVWYENADGRGDYESPKLLFRTMIEDLAIADMNMDGLDDIVYLQDDGIHVRHNAGGQGFGEPNRIVDAAQVQHFDAGDFDGDGRPDLVLREDGLVWLTNETGGFVERQRVATTPEDIRIADFNNDGVIDVVTSGKRSLDVFEFVGDAWQLSISIGGVENATRVDIGDANGDGKNEFWFYSDSSESENRGLYVLDLTSDNVMEPTQIRTYSGSAHLFSLVDVDGDDVAEIEIGGRSWLKQLPETAGRGDIAKDGIHDDRDIDQLCDAVHRRGIFALFDDLSEYDLNEDGEVDTLDHRYLVKEIFDTTYGDANLDGVFDSSDLVLVMQRARYDNDNFRVWDSKTSEWVWLRPNWRDGDWNCDGHVNSRDLVAAFTDGGYNSPANRNAIAAALSDARNQNAKFEW